LPDYANGQKQPHHSTSVTNFGMSFRGMLLFATQQFAKPHVDANFVESIVGRSGCNAGWVFLVHPVDVLVAKPPVYASACGGPSVPT
jgi:hypothetical protein